MRNPTNELDGTRGYLTLCARTRGLHDERPGAGGNPRGTRTLDGSHQRGRELSNALGESTS